jgi:hypothetical protein
LTLSNITSKIILDGQNVTSKHVDLNLALAQFLGPTSVHEANTALLSIENGDHELCREPGTVLVPIFWYGCYIQAVDNVKYNIQNVLHGQIVTSKHIE